MPLSLHFPIPPSRINSQVQDVLIKRGFHKMEFVELIKTPTVDNVILRQPFHEPVDGTLCVTGHHLILSSRKDNTEELWLLHKSVDAIEKKVGASSGTITIKCKNFKIIQLYIPDVEAFQNVASSIESLSCLEDVTYWYPFFYQPRQFQITDDGWLAFTAENEFARLTRHSEHWRVSKVNKDFAVCDTYPEQVVVPKNISDSELVESAKFRQHSRFPVLSYCRKDNSAVIIRSGQPLAGNLERRCKEDERLVNATLRSGNKGYIVDTRSASIAQVARTKGGGFEPEAHYSQWKRVHRPVERYYNLHETLGKLLDACKQTTCSTDKWLNRLDGCSWLSHIKDVLTCACLVAQCVAQDACTVLVHGSEAFDSTLQVTSLSQIILDPDCRTVRGFEALVEREWVQAGHPFSKRCAKSAFSPMRSRHEAPVFLLFLDCVWQIFQQFSCSFEFNEDFLILLFEHAYASQFGTFLCNSEKERKTKGVKEKTVSLWSYVNHVEVLPTFLNPMYEPNTKVLWPSVAAQSIDLWAGMFLRYTQDSRPTQDAWKEIANVREHEKELRMKVGRLRRHLMDLQREAVNQGLLAMNSDIEANVNHFNE